MVLRPITLLQNQPVYRLPHIRLSWILVLAARTAVKKRTKLLLPINHRPVLAGLPIHGCTETVIKIPALTPPIPTMPEEIMQFS